jgi:hypothetical protein
MWLGVSALLCGGCEQHIAIEPTKVQGFAPWSDLPAPHRLVPGDEIELKFLLNTELNDRVTIGPDGRVTVPLLGAVEAQGMTVAAFTKSLETAYAPKLRVPDLDVIVRTYGAARIFVGGEVKTPGVLAMAGQMDVLQGILAAGGAYADDAHGRSAPHHRRPGFDAGFSAAGSRRHLCAAVEHCRIRPVRGAVPEPGFTVPEGHQCQYRQRIFLSIAPSDGPRHACPI